MPLRIQELVAGVRKERLQGNVRAIEGLRHGTQNYATLEEKAEFVVDELHSFGFEVESQPVIYKNRNYRNIIATLDGSEFDSDRFLVGAHYDSPRGSPGADDNASGVAALLEAARVLAKQRFTKTIQFVAFTLEEPQTWNHSILRGSRLFVRDARRSRVKYGAVLILECVGYTDKKQQGQIIPSLVGLPVPKSGDFLGVIANKSSKPLMESFHKCISTWVPEVGLISYAVPLHGYLIPQSRFSDHSSFWNHGYPALMLTDTAMFRNPNYHTRHDTSDTLDYDFLSSVTKCVVAYIGSACGLLTS